MPFSVELQHTYNHSHHWTIWLGLHKLLPRIKTRVLSLACKLHLTGEHFTKAVCFHASILLATSLFLSGRPFQGSWNYSEVILWIIFFPLYKSSWCSATSAWLTHKAFLIPCTPTSHFITDATWDNPSLKGMVRQSTQNRGSVDISNLKPAHQQLSLRAHETPTKQSTRTSPRPEEGSPAPHSMWRCSETTKVRHEAEDVHRSIKWIF